SSRGRIPPFHVPREKGMTSLPRAVGWRLPVLVLVAWLGIGGNRGRYAGNLGGVATNDQAASLPRSAESTRAVPERTAFTRNGTVPAIVVWTADRGPVTDAQQQAATAALASLSGTQGVAGRPSPAVRSEDGRALQGIVQLRPDLGREV